MTVPRVYTFIYKPKIRSPSNTDGEMVSCIVAIGSESRMYENVDAAGVRFPLSVLFCWPAFAKLAAFLVPLMNFGLVNNSDVISFGD